jgi:hypothetical protein
MMTKNPKCKTCRWWGFVPHGERFDNSVDGACHLEPSGCFSGSDDFCSHHSELTENLVAESVKKTPEWKAYAEGEVLSTASPSPEAKDQADANP